MDEPKINPDLLEKLAEESQTIVSDIESITTAMDIVKLGESLNKNKDLEGDLALVKKLVQESGAVVLDIEGTITALDFVRKELFPYFESHLDDYIMKHWKDKEVQETFDELQKQALIDKEENLQGFVPIMDSPPDVENSNELKKYLKSIIANLKWQMANDRKTTGLKKIQGLIWRIGYENRLITGHLYNDVIGALETWKSEGKDIFIYSSGSREAQLYLFKYSKFGDVTKYFQDFFDTTIGCKLEPTSYKHICNYARRKPNEIVFFTDRPKEIYAAKQCGLKTILVVRDPDHPLIKAEEDFLGHENGRITSFTAVQ